MEFEYGPPFIYTGLCDDEIRWAAEAVERQAEAKRRAERDAREEEEYWRREYQRGCKSRWLGGSGRRFCGPCSCKGYRASGRGAGWKTTDD